MAYIATSNTKSINTDIVNNDDVIYQRQIDVTDVNDVKNDVKSDDSDNSGSVHEFINESFYRLSFRGSDDTDTNDDVVVNKGVHDVDVAVIG